MSCWADQAGHGSVATYSKAQNESRYLVIVYVQELIDDGLRLPLDLLLRQGRSVRYLGYRLWFYCQHKMKTVRYMTSVLLNYFYIFILLLFPPFLLILIHIFHPFWFGR